MPVTVLFTWRLGGLDECIIMLVLTWMYNDLGGANENYFLRNILNALGFMCYSSGSTTVAAGYGIWDRNERSHIWLAIIGAIVFSTLQIQDMPDMKGDLARGRRTLPLVHGQRIARVSIALPVLFWSFVCPFYWELNLWAYALPVVLGSTLAGRVLLLTTTHADRLTWKLWCIWVMALLYDLSKVYAGHPEVDNPRNGEAHQELLFRCHNFGKLFSTIRNI
ncbi:hypothetical protein BELL_0111g00090 [Botrytis elliptica]|uniref:UbiA prenyltransferase family n=1 Tax=Botrytis elliptica TaxID=278938 RepID=A0A4Z1JW14_9HELO|nr:hypothetical protein BELL_0111g00090 [Botrytis elliptica]